MQRCRAARVVVVVVLRLDRLAVLRERRRLHHRRHVLDQRLRVRQVLRRIRVRVRRAMAMMWVLVVMLVVMLGLVVVVVAEGCVVAQRVLQESARQSATTATATMRVGSRRTGIGCHSWASETPPG